MQKRLLGFVGLLVLVIVGFLTAPISAAPQAVFTVTTTNDADDGVCDAAHCSLREAINAANVSGAPGVINFNIIGFPPFVIQPTLPLPALTQNGIQIDGYTQLGANQNTDPSISNAILMIELSGAAAGTADGLILAGGNGSVRGLSIYHWRGAAVLLSSSANTVAGNFIGLGPDGMTSLTNWYGIWSDNTTNNNIIGGDFAAERNVISSNSLYGVYAYGSGHAVVKNLIGTNAGGTVSKPNGNGVRMDARGGEVRGNVISGNNGYGLWLDGGARKNTITDNNIGADALLSAALPNGADGVLLNNAVKKNRIGGNMITNNGGAGIALTSRAGKGNNLGGNWIFDNAGLGIDLNQDGVSPNDKFDADGGPNLMQNAPTITSAESTPQRIRGRIKTAPFVTVTLDFFANDTCDLSGFGEGNLYLGSTTVTTNAKGKAAFNWIATSPFATGQSITAVAMVKKSTSEFSACALALPG